MGIRRTRRLSSPFKVHLRREGKEAWCGRKLSHGGLRSLDRLTKKTKAASPWLQTWG